MLVKTDLHIPRHFALPSARSGRRLIGLFCGVTWMGPCPQRRSSAVVHALPEVAGDEPDASAPRIRSASLHMARGFDVGGKVAREL